MSKKFEIKEFNIELNSGKIKETEDTKLSNRDKEKLTKGDVIYIYRGKRNLYIGQTKHFYERHKEHIREENRRYVDGTYTNVILAFGMLINQQSLDDIEKNLINYVTASYSGQSRVIVDNGTKGNEPINYQNQEEVLSEFIDPFWKILFDKKYVPEAKLNVVKESILFKYSPFNELNYEKIHIIDHILKSDNNKHIISGLAGTGKTVLLTNLAARLYENYPEKKIAVVVKANFLKNAENIFKSYGIENIYVTTAYKLIKGKNKFDYILVDESHRLRRYYSKGNHVTQDIFKEKDRSENELELLIKLTNNIILFYDSSQVIRPSDIVEKDYSDFIDKYNFESFELTKEYRINVNEENKIYTGDDFINGIRSFLQIDDKKMFNKDLFKSYLTNDDAYFGVVQSINELFDYLNYSENYDPYTQNRVVAGYTREWISNNKKNKDRNDVFDWNEKGSHWKWNSTNENWIMKSNSRNEIGSIHAVQGLDLNYVGVVVSTDIFINEDGKLVGDQNNYKDRNGKYKIDDFNEEGFTTFIKNIYYVLFTRGIDGIRVYFEDQKMENYFYDFMGIEHVK